MDEEATPENFSLDFVEMGIHLFKSTAEILGFNGIEFSVMLGVSKEYDAYHSRKATDDPVMREVWKRFLKQLHGPYGKVLLRQYRIRNGLE